MLNIFFNELSVTSRQLSHHSAKQIALAFLSVLVKTNKIRKISLTAHTQISQFSVTDDGTKTFANILSGSDTREEWSYIKNLFNKSPYESNLEAPCECKCRDLVAHGLAYAYKSDTAVVSLDFPEWNEPSVLITLTYREDDTITKVQVNESARNLSNSVNLQEWQQWLIGEVADLPGFPGAKRVKPKTGLKGGMLRTRWQLPGGEILEWDYLHKEVEKYNSNGIHLGAFDPATGAQIPGKVAVAGRTVEP